MNDPDRPQATAPTALLAIECSTAVASVALWQRGTLVCREGETASATVDHVLQWCDELLRESGVDPGQLDALAVGVGPGAFTGVRVAISVAQGLALAWNKRVITVSSLAALATDAIGDAAAMPVLALMDARMDEVYAGWYGGSAAAVPVALVDEQVLPPERLVPVDAASAGYRIIGNGFQLHAQRIAAVLPPPAAVVDAVPSAAQVAVLAARMGMSASIDPGDVEPAYLRNKVALTTAERAAGKATGT